LSIRFSHSESKNGQDLGFLKVSAAVDPADLDLGPNEFDGQHPSHARDMIPASPADATTAPKRMNETIAPANFPNIPFRELYCI
jgi:hypothetical protein